MSVDIKTRFDAEVRKMEIREAAGNQPHRVWFHVTVKKIEAFTGADGVPVCLLIAGDTYLMDARDAEILSWKGAGHVRQDPPSDIPKWKRASELRDGAR